VWGYAMARGDRSVDVFVGKLRQKLELRSPGWRYIHTHFGIGYRLAPERLNPAAGELSQSGAGAQRGRAGMLASEASGDGCEIPTTAAVRAHAGGRDDDRRAVGAA
jgi:hypothetical protein